jgi:Carboxypeptidase regulatory-like domain
MDKRLRAGNAWTGVIRAAGVLAAFAIAGCGIVGPSGDQALIRGQVTDRIGRPINSAIVEVLDGPLAGTTRRSDENGRFELTSSDAISGTTVTLRVSREGIQTRTANFHWRSPDVGGLASSSFWVDTFESPVGLDLGEYALSVAIDLAAATDHPSFPHAPCSEFPDMLAVRNYRAAIRIGSPLYMFDRVVQTDDPRLLSPARSSFTLPTHLFSFAVVGPFMRFDMEEEGIFEELPGFRYLDIYGTSPGTEPVVAEGSSISLPFKAFFSYCELTSPRGSYSFCSAVPRQMVVDFHTCVAERGTMVFTKR